MQCKGQLAKKCLMAARPIRTKNTDNRMKHVDGVLAKNLNARGLRCTVLLSPHHAQDLVQAACCSPLLLQNAKCLSAAIADFNEVIVQTPSKVFWIESIRNSFS